MTYETKLSNIILRLKEVRKHHPEITLQKISEHTGVSFTTVSRIFADGSENQSFRYESVRPIAQMLLGMDNLDEGEEDEKALKAIIQFKDAKIKELEAKILEEKDRHDKKLDKERSQSRTSIEFLKNQIMLKDDRITKLMNEVIRLNAQIDNLLNKVLEKEG